MVSDRGACQTELDLIMPGTFYPGQNVLLRDIFRPCYAVIRRVVLVNHPYHSVLSFPQPTLFQVMQDRFQSAFGTSDETGIRHRDRQGTSNEPPQMGGRVGELIFFITTALEVDEDSQIMGPRRDANTGPGKFGT